MLQSLSKYQWHFFTELEENIGNKLLDIDLSNIFLDVPPRTGNNNETKQVGLHQTNKLLHCKGNHQQRATH